MIILPTLFGDKDEIEILSPSPQALHTHNDIRAIILMKYPNVKSKHIVISDPEDNVALIVGDNEVYQGWVKVCFDKLVLLKLLTSDDWKSLVKEESILSSFNSLLFGKKLGLDIWNLNQRPSSKTKLINSSKKISDFSPHVLVGRSPILIKED
ncbi:hypothetical protein [Spiroplasma endosymbiont of Virgichneumon dumeticola]|uniref:hypothetical protein n=1 Tax=Spiroplasma endosymbiont of Virgichneumon dumeticola TaxID=3139323 RepID=UPI0035C89A40